MKLKSFCTTKETISHVKRQPSEWEKIIENETIDEKFISKIYKQLLQLNSRKDPIKKLCQRTKEIFLLRRLTGGQQTHDRYSTSLIIREMQIKARVRYNLMPVRMADIKKFTNNKCWRGCREKATLLHG